MIETVPKNKITLANNTKSHKQSNSIIDNKKNGLLKEPKKNGSLKRPSEPEDLLHFIKKNREKDLLKMEQNNLIEKYNSFSKQYQRRTVGYYNKNDYPTRKNTNLSDYEINQL